MSIPERSSGDSGSAAGAGSADSLPVALPVDLRTARTAVEDARQRADRLLEALRDRLDGGEDVDRYQQICYDVARSTSQLEAARALLRVPEGDDLQTALRLHFAAVATRSFDSETAAAHDELALSPRPSTAERDLQIGVLRPSHEEDLGRRLLESGPRFDDAVLSGHHKLLRQSYRDYGGSVVAPEAEAIHRGDLAIPAPILDGLSELGCFGLSIPESYGGLLRDDEPDCLSMLLATEELSCASLGAAGSLITRPEVLARALLAGGTEEQKARWLPPLASGEQLCAVAVTEPDHGSDVASMALRAERSQGGWILNGAKMWSTFAGRAHVLMVLARTGTTDDGHRGLSLFLVEKPSYDGHDFELNGACGATGAPSVHGGSLRGRAISTLGYRGMHSYELFFDNFFVPDANLVGGEDGEGRGFYVTMAGFAGGRIQTAARAVGVMQAAFADALEYAHQRRTFGRPIAEYQLIRIKLARMASLLHGTRLFTYSAAAAMDRDEGDIAASMAKLIASRAAEWVTREAQQIHGGMGYAEETGVSRYFVDARVLSIFEGSEEILALKVIARSLLESVRGERR